MPHLSRTTATTDGMRKKRKKEGDEDEGETDGGAKKIRRPDFSQRKKERKNLESSVVKASLRGRLCKDERHWTPEARDTMLQLLDAQVESLSQMVVRGSMVANEVLLVCLREGLPLPDLSSPTFFRQVDLIRVFAWVLIVRWNSALRGFSSFHQVGKLGGIGQDSVSHLPVVGKSVCKSQAETAGQWLLSTNAFLSLRSLLHSLLLVVELLNFLTKEAMIAFSVLASSACIPWARGPIVASSSKNSLSESP